MWYFRAIGKALVRVNPLWQVRVIGKEKLAHAGPFVLVVNHQSFADLIALCFLDHSTKYTRSRRSISPTKTPPRSLRTSARA